MSEKLTLLQAARWLHDHGKTGKVANRVTLYRWIQTGLLPSTRARGRGPGGQYRIAVEDLERFEPPTERGRCGRPRR